MLWNFPKFISVSLPWPPYGDITNGLKEPCSTWMTRLLYFRFFSCSFDRNVVWTFWLRRLFANGFMILTSKNASCPLCQKLLAETSSRASSDLLELFDSDSPVKGCRWGSMDTSVCTCERRFAKRFLISSWRWWMKPPFVHERAWSTSNRRPRTYVWFSLYKKILCFKVLMTS